MLICSNFVKMFALCSVRKRRNNMSQGYLKHMRECDGRIDVPFKSGDTKNSYGRMDDSYSVPHRRVVQSVV